jgi:cytochrome c-type biogenesis protein CcmH
MKKLFIWKLFSTNAITFVIRFTTTFALTLFFTHSALATLPASSSNQANDHSNNQANDHSTYHSIYTFSSASDTQRFQSLTQEIRCVVCQSQSIADSNAALANDLRNKVYALILEKKSDDEIKNYLAQRYGEFILLRPRLNKSTLGLWCFPLLASFAVFFMLYRLMQRQKQI